MSAEARKKVPDPLDLEDEAAKKKEDEAAKKKEPDDPFDLSRLRLNPSFVETAGVKKLITTVPVRKPNPQDFVRVHPAAEYRENFLMIDLKDDRREEYLVDTALAAELTGETVMKTVFTVINRQGVVFLWALKLPAPDDRKTEWPRSEREAAEIAMGSWVRVKANMSLGAYEVTAAQGVVADPVWPEITFPELLRIGFRERIINRLDHPVVKRLRGLA
jgi:hypothetical protein